MVSFVLFYVVLCVVLICLQYINPGNKCKWTLACISQISGYVETVSGANALLIYSLKGGGVKSDIKSETAFPLTLQVCMCNMEKYCGEKMDGILIHHIVHIMVRI